MDLSSLAYRKRPALMMASKECRMRAYLSDLLDAVKSNHVPTIFI